ncbi:Flp family type IVb pilin [Nocardioides dongxiaopingii]|uniref:Flp family type IVb pilin n=1 Tax=Nocardioides dongxiaopingii TaxID=2576036 RepID=UPI0010C764E1|nr:Flp family type IVb pilin [Nocardioides dongxiaopingii]
MVPNLPTFRRSARRGERGASAVEYGLLVAGIAAIIVAVVFLLGGQITKAFDDTCGTLKSKGNGGSCSAPANGGDDGGE